MKKIFIPLILQLIVLSSSFASSIFPLTTKQVRINAKDTAQIEKILDEILEKPVPKVLIDKVENTKVEITLLNDYDFKDSHSTDLARVNDDIGKTHGFKISISKNIAPILNGNDNYYLDISYETNLYTNSVTPEEFQNDYRDTLYKNDDGYWQTDAFYKEENLFGVIVAKIESQDAYYWKAGVGFHELNTDDATRGILISSITQQKWHHRDINERFGPTYREYNYINQDASQSGVFVTAEAGRDITVFNSKNSRTFMRAGVNSRLTMVKEASFVGSYFHIGHDYKRLRFKTGVSGKVYTDNSKYTEAFAEAYYKGKYAGVKLRYSNPFTKDPNYLNALPEDFKNRDSLAAPNEPIISLSIEGHLP